MENTFHIAETFTDDRCPEIQIRVQRSREDSDYLAVYVNGELKHETPDRMDGSIEARALFEGIVASKKF